MGYPMGNCRRLRGAFANPVSSTRETKKIHGRKVLQGPACPPAPSPGCYYEVCVLCALCMAFGHLDVAAIPRGTIRQWLHRQI